MNNNTFYANQQPVKGTDSQCGLSPIPTAIPLLLNHVVTSLIPIAESKQLALQCYVDTYLNRHYLIDNVRLGEVLSNFITNAIKFTPESGEIVVRAQLIERIDHMERIRFSVKDNGVGIAEHVKPNVLSHDQAGLGLCICQHLARQLNGQIEFESQQGLGSVFSITLMLPMCLNKETHHKDTVQEHNQAMHALVVDNHTISRQLLAEIIKKQGYIVDTATNGDQALSIWKTKQHSLIFTETNLPYMDGHTLAKTIRHIEQSKHLEASTIVTWSGTLSTDEQLRFDDVGVNNFLTKPINISHLRKILAEHKQGRATHELQPSIANNNDAVSKTLSLIDYEVLDQIIPDSDKQSEVLHQLQSHVHHDYDELQVKVQAADLMGIESVAHRMKGSCKMVGVNSIASLCEKIEKTAKNGNISDTAQTLSALHDSILDFDAFMYHQQYHNTSAYKNHSLS